MREFLGFLLVGGKLSAAATGSDFAGTEALLHFC